MESKERIAKQKQSTGRGMALGSTCTYSNAAFTWGSMGASRVLLSAHRISGGPNGAQFFQMSLATTQLWHPLPEVVWAVALTT